ncbi:MAG: cysteine--tRNA ligase, partial [Alphaproteobacteria bacterium]
MAITLTNTLTRKKEPLQTITPEIVGLYVCGITPYDDSHIGHARSTVTFDILFRLLNHTFGPKNVTYIRNFTDIDDKIINRANALGKAPAEVSQLYIERYHADMAALHCLKPTHEPRVSDKVVLDGIVTFIQS